ncbi:hyaluronidase-like [Coccinella septempunctata]|uniref:hyaluronidase-like n=1 Tax=Coccinella septempunctata TaxID=41139 RepID=UPI001D06E876|nr:hyaluronidase-like [Coccinella septempunctata]
MIGLVKWIWVALLSGLCSGSSNFLVSSKGNLKVYWNIPTFQCRTYGMNFSEIADKYGIVQNPNDDFRGANITILYDPGYFPAILNESGKIIDRNGGIPQDGNIQTHLKLFQDSVNEQIPQENFTGLAIIDFESWRPIFRQNFGSLQAYKNRSVQREERLHPFWPSYFTEKEAQKKFEFHGKMFMEETLALGQKMRPKAKWGYYAYPYCFNKSPSNKAKDCPKEVQGENDRLFWLFSESALLLPSLYLQSKLNKKDKIELIEGRVAEAQRIANYIQQKQKRPAIVPYFWYKYQDTRRFLKKEDLKDAFSMLSSLRVDGVIIWGSSNDVNTKEKCRVLYNYLSDILGPILINTT